MGILFYDDPLILSSDGPRGGEGLLIMIPSVIGFYAVVVLIFGFFFSFILVVFGFYGVVILILVGFFFSFILVDFGYAVT